MSGLNIIRQILLNSFQMDHNTFIISYCILYTAIHSILVSILCRYTIPAQAPCYHAINQVEVICCSKTPPLLKALASQYEGNMKAL